MKRLHELLERLAMALDTEGAYEDGFRTGRQKGRIEAEEEYEPQIASLRAELTDGCEACDDHRSLGFLLDENERLAFIIEGLGDGSAAYYSKVSRLAERYRAEKGEPSP